MHPAIYIICMLTCVCEFSVCALNFLFFYYNYYWICSFPVKISFGLALYFMDLAFVDKSLIEALSTVNSREMYFRERVCFSVHVHTSVF